MKPWKPPRSAWIGMAAIAVSVAAIIAAGIPGPTYTDAYYYYNAGRRLAEGQGLTDPYVALTYLNAPESLPAPSHTYWMPLVSLLVALAGGSFRGAQIIFAACWVGMVLLAFWLGATLGGRARHAWAAGLLTVFCGYYAPFLVTTDAFALFGLLGALCLLATGLGRLRGDWRLYALAGALAALGHLTRADGVLLLFVILAVAVTPDRMLTLQPGRAAPRRRTLIYMGAGLLAYLLVMLPWFIRNLAAVGSPLPIGGTATIWLRGYNELVSYPPSMSAAHFWSWGAGNILQSRWEAFTSNLGTFIAVEGLVVLAPLLLLAVAGRWRQPMLLPVWLYAALLHLAMTLVFAYPGYRGGLFHSAAALLPWWMALGVLELDTAVDWIARRRRSWRPEQAKRVFTAGVIGLAILLTVLSAGRRWGQGSSGRYARVAEALLPPDAVVMSNDPAALYYETGLPGVVIPDGGPEAVRALAERYGITHVLLDENRTQPLNALYEGREQVDFLLPVAQEFDPLLRLFAVAP